MGVFFCPGGRAFKGKFCPGAGLLTTSKKFPGDLPGEGCSRLDLIDALMGHLFRSVRIVASYFMKMKFEVNDLEI